MCIRDRLYDIHARSWQGIEEGLRDSAVRIARHHIGDKGSLAFGFSGRESLVDTVCHAAGFTNVSDHFPA